MLRIILGVIVGFIVWSILWVGTDAVLAMLSPTWYGAHQERFALAMVNQDAFTADSTILLINLFRSVIVSILSGFIAAMVAGENRRSTLILGIVLLLVGILVEIMAWNYLPIWYHFVFLILIVPTTILGGKLKRSA